MGTFEEDLDRLVAETGGSVSRGEFIKAAGLAMKALGEVAGAATVAVVVLYGGFAAIAIANVFGLAVTPMVAQAVTHLVNSYMKLDTDERRAVSTIAGVLWGRIDVVWA